MRSRKKPRVTKAAIAKFELACKLLNELVADGFELYVAGSGSTHLLRGPSHEPGVDGQPLQDNIVHTVYVRTLSGGDW